MALQQQIDHLRVSKAELTGAGFYVDFDVDGDVPRAVPPNFAGGAAVIRLTGATVPAGCVLFVREGRIGTLGGYTYGNDTWTEDVDVVSVDDVLPIHPG